MDFNYLKRLPSLESIIRGSKFSFKKSLGQHFLLDDHILSRIVSYSGIIENKTIIEIGPGIGSLTRFIIASQPSNLIAIERDKECVALLHSIFGDKIPHLLRILNQDALKVNLSKISPADSILIGNLPYNIGASLLINWLNYVQHFDHMVLMFQKEVANRLVALSGTSDYGVLSVLTHIYTDSEIVMVLKASDFMPPPKVDSSVVRLIPRETPLSSIDFHRLKSVTKSIFSYRRKTLRAIFKQYEWPLDILKSFAIDEMLRPADLSPETYSLLATHLPLNGKKHV